MKIFCVGRNYAQHAKELGNNLPEQPLIFSKFPTAVLRDNQDFYLPDFSSNIHHELELVVRISKNGKHIAEKFARNYYQDITVGIDFTARDLQQQLQQKGQPWEIAKAFDNSAPLGNFVPLASLQQASNIEFHLLKNGETVQHGFSGDMIFGIDALIAYISRYFTLQQGDLLFTGTPEGVGKVAIGDRLQAFIEGKELLNFEVK